MSNEIFLKYFKEDLKNFYEILKFFKKPLENFVIFF